jgi:alpha-mannosidase
MTPGANALIMFADNPANWDAWNIDDLNGARTRVNRGVTVRAESIPGAPRAIVVTRSADSVRVVQRYLLRDDADHLDVETTIDWHPSHQLLKVAFPMAFHVDSTHAEIPYGAIARTTRPRTRADSARFETPMQRWVDASDGTVGVAIVNDGKYGYSASGDTVFVTLLRSPKWPDSTADMGVHRFTYRIVPHAGDWRAPAVRDAARSLNEPLRAVRVEQHPGRGRSASLLTVSGDGVELGALKRAEDDDRIVVRLVETAGRATVATVRLASPVHARETNLLERPVAGGWNGSGVVLRVPLRPWQIRTIALTR